MVRDFSRESFDFVPLPIMPMTNLSRISLSMSVPNMEDEWSNRQLTLLDFCSQNIENISSAHTQRCVAACSSFLTRLCMLPYYSCARPKYWGSGKFEDNLFPSRSVTTRIVFFNFVYPDQSRRHYLPPVQGELPVCYRVSFTNHRSRNRKLWRNMRVNGGRTLSAMVVKGSSEHKKVHVNNQTWLIDDQWHQLAINE